MTLVKILGRSPLLRFIDSSGRFVGPPRSLIRLGPAGWHVMRAAVLASAFGVVLAAPAEARRPHSLGGYPLCEASAATWIPCPGEAARTCLLVGDNELRQSLYAIPFDGHRLEVEDRACLDITPLLHEEYDFELSDIEALTVLGSGEILVYGSHSRNKRCKPRKKRRQYVGVRLQDGIAAGKIELERTEEDFDLQDAFPADAEGDMGALRQAVANAEAEADRLFGESDGEGDCNFADAFNIEGAAAIAGPFEDQVWLGLRAPLVGENAALIRQEPTLKKLRFDKVRLVDLDGWAIRDLTYARGWVWGLAGPVPDDATSRFKLWRFRVGELGNEGVIKVEFLEEVPNSAEGLAIWGDRAVILMDGDLAAARPQQPCADAPTESSCGIDASYVVLSVPW